MVEAPSKIRAEKGEALPRISEYNKEKKKFEPKDPKIWDVLAYAKQLDALDRYKEMVNKKEGLKKLVEDSPDYKTTNEGLIKTGNDLKKFLDDSTGYKEVKKELAVVRRKLGKLEKDADEYKTAKEELENLEEKKKNLEKVVKKSDEYWAIENKWGILAAERGNIKDSIIGSQDYKVAVKEVEEVEKEWAMMRKDVGELEKRLPLGYFSKEAIKTEDLDSYLEVSNAGEDRIRKRKDEIWAELTEKGITDEDFDEAAKALEKEPDNVSTMSVTTSSSPELPPVIPPSPEPPTRPSALEPSPVAPATPEPIQPEPRRVEPPSNLPEVRGGVTVRPEAWMGTWDTYTGGKAPQDINEIKRYVKRVGDSQGRNTLAYAYAESLLKTARANAQEGPTRQEAGRNREEVVQLEAERSRIKQRLNELRNRENTTFSQPVDGRISQLEREIAQRQSEVADLREGSALGAGFQRGVDTAYGRADQAARRDLKTGWDENKEPGKGFFRKVGRFFKERAQGFVLGFGWWEIHQAEKFRKGTKEAGKELEVQSRLVETESQLFPVSAEQVEYNRILEDKMVAKALQKLEDNLKNKSWFEQYKAANGGAVITPEKRALVEKKLRERISQLRAGQVTQDNFKFTKLIRQSLDKPWWTRYIYTGIDAVLGGLLVKAVVGKILGSGGGGGAVPGSEQAIKSAGEKVVEFTIKDHVWGDTSNFITDYLADHGLDIDTAIEKLGYANKDEMVLELSKLVAQDSNVAVPEWGISGGTLATNLPTTFVLKFGLVAAKLAKIAAF